KLVLTAIGLIVIVGLVWIWLRPSWNESNKTRVEPQNSDLMSRSVSDEGATIPVDTGRGREAIKYNSMASQNISNENALSLKNDQTDSSKVPERALGHFKIYTFNERLQPKTLKYLNNPNFGEYSVL